MDTSFGRWLRQRRRFLDLTQAELADCVGCSPVTVRKLESDERRASKQLAERLAHCLAIAPADYDRFMLYARTPPSFEPVEESTKVTPSRPPISITPSPQIDWGDAPDANVFHGRAVELAQLRDWLLVDYCRLVALLGIGGIGKTSLAVEMARTLYDQFEVVIWRSLRTAPPVEEIVDEILHTLMPDVILDSVPKLDRQIRRLLEQLRQRRCLLILDNVESILAEGKQVGIYRPGYGGYGELLRRVGESSHQSCLLITSRETPAEFAALNGMGMPVRALYLASLSPDDSRALLAHRGLTGQSESWAALTTWYSGNPLLLQAVSETIRELFQGSIDRFLQYETTLSSSVRELLAGQFARLAPLERDVLIWLALHCEPVGPGTLREEMEPLPSWAVLLDALHSLRRRSLVEQGDRGFTLQNVVMEFVTDYLVEQIVQEVAAQQRTYLQRYALLNAQVKQYVRDSQTRLVLKPVVEQLVTRFGKVGAGERLGIMLNELRHGQTHQTTYGAGNILNLLVQLNGHLRGQDFSGLVVRQASLQGVDAQDANFRGAHLDKCDFSLSFMGVMSVAFSPAGDYFMIGSATGIYCLRRLQDDYPLHRQMEPISNIWSACFSPDGKLIAAAGNDRAIFIWATESGRCLHSLIGHVGTVFSLCFSSDGTLMASGGTDTSIRIWDVQSGQCLATLLDHTNGVRDLCFSPDDKFLASASEDGTVRLWETRELPNEMRCVRVLRGQIGAVWTVAFSPDGALLAAAGTEHAIQLWDAQTSQPLATLSGHSHYVTRISFNRAGSLLASGSYDGTVRVWETTTGQCVRVLQGHTGRVWAVAFSPDGMVVASGSSDQSVRLWDLDAALDGGRCLKTLRGYANTIRSVAFSPDGTLVASGGQDRLVRLWEASTGRYLSTLSGHNGSIWHVHFSPDGCLLVSAGHDSIIRLWDVASGRCVHEIEQVEGCDATSFHPSGTVLATANLDRTITLWSVQSWQRLATLRGHPGEVWAVAFSPDGTLLASGSMDNSVRLWDWRSGQCLNTFQGHTSYVRAVSFSPDGTLLASCGYDSTVRLWDISHPGSAATCVVTIPGPGDAAQLYVTFSPDGTLLASAGVDGLIHIWEVSSAVGGNGSLCVLEGHEGKVYSLCFRNDGRILVSSSEDGTIRMWDVGDLRHGIACVQILYVERPYSRMNIAGVTGLTQAQITSLQTLGSIEEG